MLGVVGSLALDLVDGEPPRIGGAVYYAAGALRRLSASPTVLARSAPADRPADFDADWLPASVTTTFSFSYEGDVRRMHVEALGDPWTPEDVGGRLEGVEWLHVGALLRSDFPAETLAALGEGRVLSLAGHGLVRAARTGPLRLDADFDPRMLDHVDILLLAEEEAAVLPLDEIEVSEVVVTRASRGSVVRARGRETHIEARPVADADPTGAGDKFAAAYLAARWDGADPVGAARGASYLVSEMLERK